jgi:hypothetical protein
MKAPLSIDTLKGVGAKIIPLCLYQVSGQPGAAVGIIVAKGTHKAWSGESPRGGSTDYFAEASMGAGDGSSVMGIKKWIYQIGAVLVNSA